MDFNDTESGYLEESCECYTGNRMTDIEILGISKVNVVACGRRYGRKWLIKGLREELRNFTASQRQMKKEFEIHSRLNHPSVARVVGLEEIEGLGLCIIEEWLEGRTLSEVLRDGNTSKADRRRILFEIVEAIAYLHSRGVVHRDIKPSNIIVRSNGGNAVLIDFGLADTDDYVEFKQGAGTRGFISPEQLESETAKTTDDIYSIGSLMKSLYPEYRSLASKCAGPCSGRPKDAGELLKALRRRKNLPRNIITAIIAVLLFVVLLLTASRIINLSDSVDKAQTEVRILTGGNKRNLERIANLKDSLTQVSNRMIEAENELNGIKEYNSTREQLTVSGRKKIDAILAKYDREVFNNFTPDDRVEFVEASRKVSEDLAKIVDNYMASKKVSSAISAVDRETLKNELINYYTISFAKYNKIWMLKVFPETNQMQ